MRRGRVDRDVAIALPGGELRIRALPARVEIAHAPQGG